MFLARRGFRVDVFERRPEPASDAVDTGRAYIIILIPRGQAALSELGIELPKSGHNVSQGTVRHARSGTVSVTKEPGNVTFSRAGLAQFLIDEAKRRYPDKIAFHFEAPCQAVDLDARTATFASVGASSAGAGWWL
jgi:ubiquitin carboxyl-terminal hydrolase 48